MALKKGKIMTVASTKGGVGKTIVTLILSNILSELKQKTLVVDLDLYGGALALDLNIEPNKSIYNVTDDLENNRYKTIDDYVTRYNEYLDVLPAPKDPRQASKVDSKYLELLFNSVIYKYDVILVDTSHSLDDNTISTMDISDAILYIITNDFMDIKNARNFISILKDIEFDNLKVIMNRSIDFQKDYFSLFDIKHVLKTNIDYSLGKNMHIADIDKYLIDGNFNGLIRQIKAHGKKEYDHLVTLVKEIIKEREK